MKLEKILKKLILIVAVSLIGLLFLLNVFFVSSISNNSDEYINIEIYGILGIAMSALIAIGIYILCNKNYSINIKMSNKSSKIVTIDDKKIKISIAIVMIIAYIIGQFIWINYRDGYPIYDQQMTYDAAKSMYEGDDNYILRKQYFELYPQQLTTASIWNAIFNVFKSCDYKILQYLNVFANLLSLLAIYLITKELSKKYTVNKLTSLVIYVTFLTVPMLSTFVYGDEQGMAMSLLGVYFIMKYGESNKFKYAIISSLFMAISYALRMNNLIWILAIIVYLVLNLFKQEKIKDTDMQKIKGDDKLKIIDNKKLKIKDNDKSKTLAVISGIIAIILFTIISIMPATIIKSNLQTKYELNKEYKFPTVGFLYMGMENGTRSAGWYDDKIADISWNNIKNAKSEYSNRIKERISYFAHNPLKMAKFYIKKTTSMWTENTYAEIWYNQSFNIGHKGKRNYQKDEWIRNNEEKLRIYQKSLILLIFGISLAVIIKNKGNLSNELLLLLTIFIGGFLFHTIWEAKSRYIISYIVALIPITAICIKENDKFTKKNERKEYEEK